MAEQVATERTRETALHLVRDRKKIPDRYKWRLTDVYPSDEAWKAEKAKLVGEMKDITGFRGLLGSDAAVLFNCLDLVSGLEKLLARLHCYASMNSDLDTRDAVCTAMEQEISQIGSEFSAICSFIQPELISKLSVDRIGRFIESEPRLEVYRHELNDLIRRKEHTRDEGEEEIIAQAGLMADAPNSVYGIFSDADFPFPEVTRSDGVTVRLDKPAFTLLRASPDRADRKNAFEAFYLSLNGYRRTFGAQLYAQMKRDLFYMKARRYNSCLEKALDGGNIPVDVYHSLIDNANANLPTFHRYLRLRERLLGVDQLHAYDLYCPVVREIDPEYTYEEASKLVLESLSPLGAEYIHVAGKALTDRWIDVFPNDGKRSGAYSNGWVYDVHPYILMNYNGKYDDVSTLAHELGHTMHSYLSNKAQPFPTAHYSIFVAEVASTFNESLLMDHMLKSVTSDDVRLTLLAEILDSMRGTVFRQAQFAEFELRIHEAVERGETLTGDGLNELYDRINKRYYGHDQGICLVGNEMNAEWAYIPHFYYNFYVFQYATSYTASVALSAQVLSGDTEARRRYLELLSSGGSDYPVNLLKKAGVDLTTGGPFNLTITKMNRVMDEIESLLPNSKDDKAGS